MVVIAEMADPKPSDRVNARKAAKGCVQKPGTNTLEEAETTVPVGTLFQKSTFDSLFPPHGQSSTGLFGGSAKPPVNLQDEVALIITSVIGQSGIPSPAKAPVDFHDVVAPILTSVVDSGISSSEGAPLQSMNASTSPTGAAKIPLPAGPEITSSENLANIDSSKYISATLLTAEEIKAHFGQSSTAGGTSGRIVFNKPIPDTNLKLSSSDSSSKSGLARDASIDSDRTLGMRHRGSQPPTSTSQDTSSSSAGHFGDSAGTSGSTRRNYGRFQSNNNPSNAFSSALAGLFNGTTRISRASGDYKGSQATKYAYEGASSGLTSHVGGFSSMRTFAHSGGNHTAPQPPKDASQSTSSNSGKIFGEASASGRTFAGSQTPITPPKTDHLVRESNFTSESSYSNRPDRTYTVPSSISTSRTGSAVGESSSAAGPSNYNTGPLPSPPLMYKAFLPKTTTTSAAETTQTTPGSHFAPESSYSNTLGRTFAAPSPVATEGEAQTLTNSEKQTQPPLSPFSSITLSTISPQTKVKEPEFIQHGIIISAFNGTGKTHFHSQATANLLSARYSGYHFHEIDVSPYWRIPNFPQNYVDDIKEIISTPDTEGGTTLVLLISGRAELAPYLEAAGLRYYSVYPELRLKQEYQARYQAMGWPQPTVDQFDRNWWRYIGNCEAQTVCKHVVLKKRQFLSDVTDRILFTELLIGISDTGRGRGGRGRGREDIRVSSSKDEVFVSILGFQKIRIAAETAEDLGTMETIVGLITTLCWVIMMVGVGSAFLVMSYIMLFYVGYDV
ncbi:uncharacterized protein PAC_11880 [Phialocephala subalpina]|uniref:Uncharacterized protein n=1 Tax=Phialocephala subalpina TaxID=576137 RepID=A0A1L7XAB6_9HELO|nr:uncharacterized protein PAC_11880 [Phialocephala subalpina]